MGFKPSDNLQQRPDFRLENSPAKFKHKPLCGCYVNGAILFLPFSVRDFFALFLPRGKFKSMKTQKRDYYCVRGVQKWTRIEIASHTVGQI